MTTIVVISAAYMLNQHTVLSLTCSQLDVQKHSVHMRQNSNNDGAINRASSVPVHVCRFVDMAENSAPEQSVQV